MKKVVVLTGAGISKESGVNTFRDAGGLWEGYPVEQVASPEGFAKDPELVLNFYNMRRKNVLEVHPNDGHKALVDLEKHFDVTIVTQNVDNLHERAGSTNVIHLHGELLKVRSTGNPTHILDWDKDLNLGDLCNQGHQLRPHIVWFGEAVPMIEPAIEECEKADYFLVIGTSLLVYPAAGLIQYVPFDTPKVIIDPVLPNVGKLPNIRMIEATATKGVPQIVQEMIKKHG